MKDVTASGRPETVEEGVLRFGIRPAASIISRIYIIVNGLKRHFVGWDDVAGFEPSSRPSLFAVRRTSGGTVAMDGITPETFGATRTPGGRDPRTRSVL